MKYLPVVSAFVAVGLMSGCASAPAPPPTPVPALVATPPPAPTPPKAQAGLIISGQGKHEVLVNGKSYGAQDSGAWSFQVDGLIPGDYVVQFVDKASGRVGVTTSYTAELAGEGYLRVHHAPRR